MLSLKERANWVINYVVRDRDLTNKKIAKKVGIGEETVAAYRNKATDPKIKFISEFCYSYDINFLWFARGEGEPFLGAKERYPEVCGPLAVQDIEKIIKYNLGKDKRFSAITIPEQGYEDKYFSGAIIGLIEILNSGDPILIPAIQANIHAFRLSVRREQQIQQQFDEINNLKKENEEVKKRLAALEEKHKPSDPHAATTESLKESAI